jgi:hypothetical protein
MQMFRLSQRRASQDHAMDGCQFTWKGKVVSNVLAVDAEHCALTYRVQKQRHLREDVVKNRNQYVNKAMIACKPQNC